jgi:hypothetical protein
MATSQECNDEWERGYTDGYREFRSTRPTIPSRPGSYPPGEDPLNYFYRTGLDRGRKKGIQDSAGIKGGG